MHSVAASGLRSRDGGLPPPGAYACCRRRRAFGLERAHVAVTGWWLLTLAGLELVGAPVTWPLARALLLAAQAVFGAWTAAVRRRLVAAAELELLRVTPDMQRRVWAAGTLYRALWSTWDAYRTRALAGAAAGAALGWLVGGGTLARALLYGGAACAVRFGDRAAVRLAAWRGRGTEL